MEPDTFDTIIGPDPLFCPVCRKQLVEWKKLRLETLSEHVGSPDREPSLKSAMHCPDENCPTRQHGLMWDNIEGGLFFANGFLRKAVMNTIPFIDSIHAPFGSFNRGWETAKAAEEKANTMICQLPSWLWHPLGGMKIYRNWTYLANNDGKITSRHFALRYIRKDGVCHMWGWRMFCFNIHGSFLSWRRYRKNPKDIYSLNELKHEVERMKWPDAEWWRIWSGYFAKFLLKHLPDSPETV